MLSKNQKSTRFSFIIPVYNVESYLVQCIDSILKQDYSDYEIILVDDGSTDSSGSLCDKLTKKEERIHVIHQKNGGLSAARNTGIRNACGEYILFVDSDDYITFGILRKIEEAIIKNKNPDVVFLETVKVYPNGKTEPMNDGFMADYICGKTKNEVLKFITIMPKFPGSACSKAIKRTLLDSSMFFTEGIISEDIDWSYRLFEVAEKYAYLPDVYYCYRQDRQGSITNTVSMKNIESIFWIIENWANKNPVGVYQTSINSFVAYQYMILLLRLIDLDKETRKTYLKRAVDLKWILAYGKSAKLRLVKTSVKLIGVKNTACLLKLYKKH